MKKYQLSIHKSGRNSTAIFEMLANANEGLVRLNLMDIVGHINCLKARYPSADKGLNYVWDAHNPNGTTLHVSEDGGETFTLSITQIELHQLENAIPLTQIAEA